MTRVIFLILIFPSIPTNEQTLVNLKLIKQSDQRTCFASNEPKNSASAQSKKFERMFYI